MAVEIKVWIYDLVERSHACGEIEGDYFADI